MKSKVKIRKEVKVVALLMGVSLLIAFSERKQGGAICSNIQVEMKNAHNNYFLDEAEILRQVETSGQQIKGINLERINFKRIESKLKLDKHIVNAELYGDLKGNLIVSVELRRPIARIVQQDGPNAYIAEDGTIMSVSENYTSRVILVSGSFVKGLMESEDLKKSNEGLNLLSMIKFIQDNEFWNAQIAQLDIDNAGKITMYPQVTGQLIEFGLPTDLEIKFRKLMIFYKEILPTRGWTKYDRVNVEFEGQIIAK